MTCSRQLGRYQAAGLGVGAWCENVFGTSPPMGISCYRSTTWDLGECPGS